MFEDTRKVAIIVGFLILLHATIAVISFRNSLKVAGESFVGVPPPLMIETALGAAACTWGALGAFGEFLPIRSQRRDAPPLNHEKMGDFQIFNHRGKAFKSS